MYTYTDLFSICSQIISDSVLPHLQRRGPDHIGKKDFSITNNHRNVCLSLVGTVLHLRGTKTPQPLEDECGNVLLWNGEIFGGIEVCLCKINEMFSTVRELAKLNSSAYLLKKGDKFSHRQCASIKVTVDLQRLNFANFFSVLLIII